MRTELLKQKYSKLLIITRDGTKYHEIISRFNLDPNSCIRLKSFPSQLNLDEIKGYIIVRPTPPGIDKILERLELDEIPNLTKRYSM